MIEIIKDDMSGNSGRDDERYNRELSFLFGHEIVYQARLIDAADLNLTDAMIKSIATGVTRLKQLRNNTRAQIAMLESMNPGERILLCLWIMDMELLDKIQSHS